MSFSSNAEKNNNESKDAHGNVCLLPCYACVIRLHFNVLDLNHCIYLVLAERWSTHIQSVVK